MIEMPHAQRKCILVRYAPCCMDTSLYTASLQTYLSDTGLVGNPRKVHTAIHK